MSTENLILGLVSSLLGGTVVSLVAYFANRPRVVAETRKLDAETERIKAETTIYLRDVESAQTDLSESELPRGWHTAGSRPEDYVMGIDHFIKLSGHASAFIEGQEGARGFGTMMQSCGAGGYRGRRLRMSGRIKTENVAQSAAFWLRIDGQKRRNTLKLDNMHDRQLRGTVDWQWCNIVMDVPSKAVRMAFGFMLSGTGRIWVDQIKFDTVEEDVPTTSLVIPSERWDWEDPTNLDFSG